MTTLARASLQRCSGSVEATGPADISTSDNEGVGSLAQAGCLRIVVKRLLYGIAIRLSSYYSDKNLHPSKCVF